jgi:hypothetical protein
MWCLRPILALALIHGCFGTVSSDFLARYATEISRKNHFMKQYSRNSGFAIDKRGRLTSF